MCRRWLCSHWSSECRCSHGVRLRYIGRVVFLVFQGACSIFCVHLRFHCLIR